MESSRGWSDRSRRRYRRSWSTSTRLFILSLQTPADSYQVIVSFIVTAHATFVLIIFGYLTFSFEDICINGADDKMVECIRRCGRKLYRRTRHILTKNLRRTRTDAIDFSSEDFLVLDRTEQEDSPTRKDRIDRFRDFMLALSDQQLVTGLAMLVAGFGRFRDITIYSTSVVTALAYFSSSVHMGTLDFITTYLRAHRLLNIVRAFSMVCICLSLVCLLALSISDSFWVKRNKTDIFAICAFYHFSSNWARYVVLGRGWSIVSLLFVFTQRLWTLYSKAGPTPQGQHFLVTGALLARKRDRFDYRGEACKNIAKRYVVMRRGL